MAGWRCWWFHWKTKQTDVFLTSNWTPGKQTGLILLCQIQTRSLLPYSFIDTGCISWGLKLRLLSSAGQSGRGRPRWDWSCWRRLETTPPCRGCSHPRTSIRRAWCPTWTPERPSTCTEAPRRPRRPYRDPWSRASCCTACREAASLRRLLCPQCPACFPGQLSSGELAPACRFFFVVLFVRRLLAAWNSLEEITQRQKKDSNVTNKNKWKKRLLSAFIWCKMTGSGWTLRMELCDWNSNCLGGRTF